MVETPRPRGVRKDAHPGVSGSRMRPEIKPGQENRNMNSIQLTSIAIQLQGSLGHSAGDIDLKEVPRLLKEAPLEAVEALKGDLLEARKASEAAYRVYAAEPPHPVHHLCSETLQAYHELLRVEEEIQRKVSSSTRIWFQACGSPEWAGIYTPEIKYSTPKGSSNWDLTGPRPRVWIERSKPGRAGLGEKGEEVVTYDVLSGRLSWTERAEARHLYEASRLIQVVDPGASATLKAEGDRLMAGSLRSAFRVAMLAISIEDPQWDLKWSLLSFGETLVERAVRLGPDFYPGMTRYFTTREASSKFSEALASENYTLVWEAAKLAA